MNPKLQKTIEQIAKNNEKIAELQNAARELERKKTQLENAEIIAAVRSGKVSMDEITRILGGGVNAPLPAKLPELKFNTPIEDADDEQEDNKDE
jgi:hypothetical protein